MLDSSLIQKSSRVYRPGFTLIEVLVVMTIIIVLAGIVISVQRGVYHKQSQAKAKGEMQAIATALESFKLKYGDYPWLGDDNTASTRNPEKLFNLLTGSEIMFNQNGTVMIGQPPNNRATTAFLGESEIKTDSDTDPTYFVDPWGNPYRYYYKNLSSPDSWEYPAFILMSAGPDGTFTASKLSNGAIDTDPESYFGDAGNSSDFDNLVHGFEF
ncbi:prepilin-type N-terminal cleavage/methylation domain-containing protein [Rubellicoccus peritrichatus]|uniref:Prepilin-type N-terminal cleavage/methylation domain-containing protein n=1 Tax=Rubellicoccus peritrichatus TaxID=3080537 RepID=A0AAQ3LJJ5_9BACT|nr:prepilin-type N-terminal cleavage/methylation domain-containing protein [Puniceicoccus sp. CR14]WOO43384.1 prepilin-type N-terminal cleavage/methylation domain-containing protein [Puniceicoccus sp. CR14]